AIASTSSGVIAPRKRYITSRHVQKLSVRGPGRSASPAIPRWKAWLWRLAAAGTAISPDDSPGNRGAFVSTDAILPDASVRRTTRAQPDGGSAWRKNSEPAWPAPWILDTVALPCMYRQV